MSILISVSNFAQALECGTAFNIVDKAWTKSVDYISSRASSLIVSSEVRNFSRSQFFKRKNEYLSNFKLGYSYAPIVKPYEILSYLDAYKEWKSENLTHFKATTNLSDIVGKKNQLHKTSNLLAIANGWLQKRVANELSIKELVLTTTKNNKLSPDSILAINLLKPESHIHETLKLLYEVEAQSILIREALEKLGIKVVSDVESRRNWIREIGHTLKNPSLNLIFNLPLVLMGDLPVIFHRSNTFLNFLASPKLAHLTYLYGFENVSNRIHDYHKPHNIKYKLKSIKSNLLKYWNVFALSSFVLGNPFYGDLSQKLLPKGDQIIAHQQTKATKLKKENDEAIHILISEYRSEIAQIESRIDSEPENKFLLEQSILEIESLIGNLQGH